MTKHLFTIFFLAALGICAAAKNPEALRIDYVRSGNENQEHIHAYRITEEPYFSGPKKHRIFPFDYGSHKVEVAKKNTGEVIYSYHYNSLFYEWQYIPQEAKTPRTFPGSVKIPYPQETITLTFFSRNDSLQWKKKQAITIDPQCDMIVKAPPAQYPIEKIHDAGDYSEKLDLVILPEGYREEDMAQFHTDAMRFKEYLFGCKPFNTHKGKINIWRVDVPSIDRSISKPHLNRWKNTAFNSHYNTFGFARYITTNDHHSLREAAAGTPYDLIIILVNETKYGGGGIFNFFSIISAGSSYANYLIVHELGHHLAFLADEYVGGTSYEEYYPVHLEPLEPNITTLVNFGRKWKDMVHPSTPVPTPEKEQFKEQVGAFEGAGYEKKGVFRPYMNCTMGTPTYDNFCPVCKNAIINMLNYYANKQIN